MNIKKQQKKIKKYLSRHPLLQFLVVSSVVILSLVSLPLFLFFSTSQSQLPSMDELKKTKRCYLGEYSWVIANDDEDCTLVLQRYNEKSKNNDVVEKKAVTNNNNPQVVKSNSPDEAIHCNVDAKCGGGTIPLKRSECEVAICCEVKPNEWKTVFGNENCDSIQKANGENKNVGTKVNTSINRLPFNATETSVKGTFYCYEDKVNTMTSQQSFVKTIRENYENCRESGGNDSIYNSCANENKCFDKTGSEMEACYKLCYDQAYGDCNSIYSDYSSERSKLDQMKWDYCP